MKISSIAFSLLLCILSLIASCQVYAFDKTEEDIIGKKRAIINRLKQLDLKKLAQVQFYNPEATSAARKKPKLLDTPAALFIISQEDIRRAGITSIPEALRLAPGIQVARIGNPLSAMSLPYKVTYLELSLGGRNLLDKQHFEFMALEAGVISREVPREFFC
jgi:iron complex outermembrane receptor protein